MSFMTERALSAREFLDECLAFKRAHPVQSRFFSVFLEGRLTSEQLRLWALDMYHYIQPAIPALTAWLAHAPTIIERDTARLVASNLAGEMGFVREADHRDLYLKFLAGLDITEAEARDHLPLPSTIGAASAIGYFCRSSRSEEHTSELQSPCNLVCRLLLEKKKKKPSEIYSSANMTHIRQSD